MSYDLALKGNPDTDLTAYDKKLVEDLVREYFRDLDVGRAARRLGIPWQDAFRISRSRQFELLKAEINEMREPHSIVTKQQVILRLWEEANNFIDGNSSTRNAALDKLAAMLGYNAPTETNVNFKAAAVVNVTESTERVDPADYEETIRRKLKDHIQLLRADVIEAETEDV